MSSSSYQRPTTATQLSSFCEKRNTKLIKLEKNNSTRTVLTPIAVDDTKPLSLNKYFICTFNCCGCKKDTTLTACVLIDNHVDSDCIFCKGCSHSKKLTTRTINDVINEAKKYGFTYTDDLNRIYKKGEKYNVRCINGHEIQKNV